MTDCSSQVATARKNRVPDLQCAGRLKQSREESSHTHLTVGSATGHSQQTLEAHNATQRGQPSEELITLLHNNTQKGKNGCRRRHSHNSVASGPRAILRKSAPAVARSLQRERQLQTNAAVHAQTVQLTHSSRSGVGCIIY